MNQQLNLFAPPIAFPSGAVLSACGRYRYRLWRKWGQGAEVVFVMLNPSTADASTDDPTIRRCITFATRLGYAGLQVVNLFALRATDPRELWDTPDPIGPENDQHLLEVCRSAPRVIAAWGGNGLYLDRGPTVAKMLGTHGITLHALKVLQDGSPGHPLYLRGNLRPVEWRQG